VEGELSAPSLEGSLLGRFPSAFYELNDGDAMAVAEAAQHHSKGRSRLSFARPGMHDHQPAVRDGFGHAAILNRLAPLHSLGVLRIARTSGIESFSGLGFSDIDCSQHQTR
jgi:hypothetical protein